jgi:hypothetical protein
MVTELEWVTPRFRAVQRGDSTVVWLTDECGCSLHTEPVATVNAEYHPSFVEWLERQVPDYQVPGLLYHFRGCPRADVAKEKAG